MTFKKANWPAPTNISALSTTRTTGYSITPFDNNNLGLHVGDNALHVMKNRQQIRELLQLSNEPEWLEQTHSNLCVIAEKDRNRNADAIITLSPNHPLVILTGDCLPIVLCSRQGDEIAAIHGGWRGLFNGIIENTLSNMKTSPLDILVWIGPAICQHCYPTGQEVYTAFTGKYPITQQAFKKTESQYFADLPKIAEIIFNVNGVDKIYQSNLCTFELNNEFYSYRRSSQTGRIGTFIWFNA